jgi:hypothetical protein
MAFGLPILRGRKPACLRLYCSSLSLRGVVPRNARNLPYSNACLDSASRRNVPSHAIWSLGAWRLGCQYFGGVNRRAYASTERGYYGSSLSLRGVVPRNARNLPYSNACLDSASRRNVPSHAIWSLGAWRLGCQYFGGVNRRAYASTERGYYGSSLSLRGVVPRKARNLPCSNSGLYRVFYRVF